MEQLLRLLRPGVQGTPPRRGEARKQLRQARAGRRGRVRDLRRAGPVRGGRRLQGLRLPGVVGLQQQVLRGQGARAAHHAVRLGQRQDVLQREPEGGLAVQPGPGRAALDDVRPRPGARVQARHLGGVVEVQHVVRRGPKEPLPPYPQPRRQRRPAVPRRARRDGAVQHGAVRRGRVPGLQVGRLVGVGRLHQVRRPALPAPRDRAPPEPVWRALRVRRDQGD
mmetsp:Transcript_42916/g.113645  ORF Transcript_42916/g.113645 Transcript_42916/m.113645 type:complete len:223 (+) Transcript_42916:1145-1813(+)